MVSDSITALDIGTRSVVGLTMEKNNGKFRIIAAAVEEHKERAMYDGQIHDIPLVTEVVARIKQQLEKDSGQSIEEVAVAAAGRSLKTSKGYASIQLEPHQITRQDILALEMQAVQTAQQALQKNALDVEYHCVGYSVIYHCLDGSRLGNLLGQNGEQMEVEIIATFLPRIVVESLFTVLNRAGLRINSLTLEPIAAAEIAIPANMRQLNLALIDIGAGTSDIAITSSGAIHAYAMVPIAGDEITEKIAEHFLLDFQTAEKVKRSLHKATVRFADVVGISHTVPSENIRELIAEAVTALAKQIATAILELNGKSPQAVICIGGGSLSPGFVEKLASYLELPVNRIGVKGKESLLDINGTIKKLHGPQMITPIGIAISGLKSSGLNFVELEVNNKTVRLLAIKNLYAADALLAAGINLKQLYGKPGKALTVQINGQLTFLRGEKGKPAQLLINGLPGKLEDKIAEGFSIDFTPAVNGKDCTAVLRDILPVKPLSVQVNKKEICIRPQIKVNGNYADLNSVVEDNAVIEYQPMDRVETAIRLLGIAKDNVTTVKINGVNTTIEAAIEERDYIEIQALNNEQQSKSNFTITLNGEKTAFIWSKKIKPILSDLFAIDSITLQPRNNMSSLVMKVNGKQAGFTTALNQEDSVELYWE